jgi:small conductance mechanosensitive channel
MEFNAETLTPMITSWAIKLVMAIAIYVIGKWIVRRITNIINGLMGRADFDPTLVNFLGNIIYAFLLAAVILAALDVLGVPVTSLLAVLGAAGLAIGLALKDSLGNFAAGVMLVLFRPFKKGDFVEAGGVSGVVAEVRIFSTILTTPDNKQVTVPNGQVGADTITNYSANDTRRVDMVFGVSYDDDLKVARKVLEDLCANHPLVLKDPAPVIMLAELGGSSVDFNVRHWVKTLDYWNVRGELLEQGKIALEAAGCSIPYPQRDVHLFKADSESQED